ncbi:eCIS core domain-containing protein [Nostoc sp.]|uniref:eCIS core domain-containing protein n=1 Tax=Nostoc sp. TaxID=1180 RepID=UPI002FF47CA7
MLHAPVNDKKTKPETSRSEVQQEAQRLKSFSGGGDRRAQGQNSRLAAMQQAYGNQAVLRMMNGGVLQRKCACGNAAGLSGTCAECQSKPEGMLQTKLKISEPGDQYEQEADRIADQVMRTPISAVYSGSSVGQLRRQNSSDTGEPHKQSIVGSDASDPRTSQLIDSVLGSNGHLLDPETRAFMEPRFGQDFSHVRIHTGNRADESARAVYAKAYTLGNHIVFAHGQYQPHTASGQHLLAHELTHTLQQSPFSHSVKNVSSASRTVQRSPLMIQRVLSTLCFEPGQLFFPLSPIFSPMLASAFGIIAHKLIALDYLASMGALPADVYFDASFAGPIDPKYGDFIIAKNPSMGFFERGFIRSALKRPDMLIDDGVRHEYEEVKPLSAYGVSNGIADLTIIDFYMTSILSLPYRFGTSYSPSSRIPIGSTTFAGLPFEFSLGVRRFRSGLIVYQICIRTDWLLATAYLAAVALLALLIALFPEVAPILIPALAANEPSPSEEQDETATV